MTPSDRHSSDDARAVLANKVDDLRKEVDDLKQSEKREQGYLVQQWMYMFGIAPNGPISRIEPTPESWCGMVTAGIQSLKKTMYLIAGLILLNAGVAHGQQIVELLKVLAEK